MGAQIACLLASAGATVRLLDSDAAIAARGLEGALRRRPSPVYQASDAERIRPGGPGELADAIGTADWVIEAVVEDLGPKRDLLERVDSILTAGRVDAWPTISTNTSGLGIEALAAGRSVAFRRAFLGAHFFNPPRYARLLEVIPTRWTDPATIRRLEQYASRHLGKGTVRARDTPAFIANRLGVYVLLRSLVLAGEVGLGIDEVDELTGPLIGRPRSATFRTMDLVGLDVVAAVARHCHAALTDDPDRESFAIGATMERLLEEGALGDKAGRGFYRRAGTETLVLDLSTGGYRSRRPMNPALVDLMRAQPDLRERLRTLLAADNQVGTFLRRLFDTSLRYAAVMGPKVAACPADVDAAMRWGFGWALGPFELSTSLANDTVGAGIAELPRGESRTNPDGGRAMPGDGSWSGHRAPVVAAGRAGRRTGAHRSGPAVRRVLKSSDAATLRDLGTGILGLELHGRLNVLGSDVLDVVARATDLASRAHDGLVIGTDATDFSVGADLVPILRAAEQGDWTAIERAVQQFQGVVQAIRFCAVPVVAAARGLTLGGGAELCVAAARCQPLAETYAGLVETSVGLVPAGGGMAALARRAAELVPGDLAGDLYPVVERAFEMVTAARVSTSAAEARAWGLFAPADLITANPDRQWADAVAVAAGIAEIGYRPPAPASIRVVGRRGIAAVEAMTFNGLASGHLSEHDRAVAMEVARVICGGDVAEGTKVAEQYLLDLERDALLRLLGEPKTRERIRHTLDTGKPLRN